MRRLITLLVFASPLLAQHTYYVSKSLGLDTRTSTQAQSKSTPWAHFSGMQGATSNAASYNMVAGDNFILYGGDTWGALDLGIEIDNNGTSGSPIYIGVDQTWWNSGVCGGAWCRPIFNCAGACSGAGNKQDYFFNFGAWITVDNLEFTGGLNTTYGQTFNIGDVFENVYAHGWSHTGSSADTVSLFSFANSEGFASTSSGIHDTIIDGSDTTEDSMEAIGGNPAFAYNNIVRYVTNGLQGGFSNAHDNWVGPIVDSFAAGSHQNAISIFGTDNGETTQVVYNNVIANSTCSTCGGVVKLWLNQFDATGVIGYAFDNVIFNNTNSNYIALGGHTAINNGTWNFFNNTVECGTNSAQGDCADDAGGTAGMTMTVHFLNNHWITGTTAVSCTFITCTNTTNLTQSVATASGQGYTSGSTQAFSPTSGAGSTVTAGTNEQSLCTTINGFDTAAGAACKNSTGYACTYNTGNHTVSCPNLAELTRPTSTAWDIGAYQFSGGASFSGTQVFGNLVSFGNVKLF